MDLLTENGFSADFVGLTFDKDTYELTGQNTFFLKNCAVLEKLLESEVDEVIKKEAYVQVMLYEIQATEKTASYYEIIVTDFAGNVTRKKLTSQYSLLTWFHTSIDRSSYNK